MSDKKNNIMNDDEYQFPKDEYLQHSATATADSGRQHDDKISDEKIVANVGVDSFLERFPILRNKKFYFFFVFLGVLFVGLHLMHRGANVTPVVQAPSAESIPVPQAPSLADQLDAMKSDVASNQEAMNTMQNHLSALDSKLDAMTVANTQLAQSVTALTAQLQLVAQNVQKNTATLAAQAKKAIKGKPVYHPKPITYNLTAVVPGRAWIDASNGYSYTVAVGDRLAQYGSVTAIDDQQGRITTTSGKVITYGPNDK